MILPGHPAADRRAADRWRYWEPWTRLAGMSSTDAHSLHASRLGTLLQAGISWRAIRHYALDDPRHPTPEFETLLRKYGHYARGQKRRHAHARQLQRRCQPALPSPLAVAD